RSVARPSRGSDTDQSVRGPPRAPLGSSGARCGPWGARSAPGIARSRVGEACSRRTVHGAGLSRETGDRTARGLDAGPRLASGGEGRPAVARTVRAPSRRLRDVARLGARTPDSSPVTGHRPRGATQGAANSELAPASVRSQRRLPLTLRPLTPTPKTAPWSPWRPIHLLRLCKNSCRPTAGI